MSGRPSISVTPTIYNAIQLARSSYGQPVPLAYGQVKLPGFLMYYDDFTATPHSVGGGGKGGGGSNSQTYLYTATIMMGLCEGPITAVLTIYAGAAQHTSMADLGFSNLALGAVGQAVWSFLTSNHPTKAIPYSSIAHIDAAPFSLGSSAGLPNLQFETAALQQFGGGVIDAEPSAMLVDYMTDPGHGANFPYLGALTGANSFQQWCVSMGMFVSYLEDTQRAAIDFVKEILKLTNSAGVIRGDGNLYFVPYCDVPVSGNGGSFTPNMTPLFAFTDDDYCPKKGEDPVIHIPIPYTQTFNWVNVEYTDRSNKYNTAVVPAFDDNDVALNGPRVMPTVSLHAIPTATLAKLVATLILNRNLYYLNKYQFRVRGDYAALEPMDLVSFTDSNLSITNVLGRITEIEEDDKGLLTIIVEEVPIGPATAPLYNWQPIQGYSTNMAAAPGSVNAPYIFIVPAGLSPDGQARIGIAINGPNNGLWAGANVWVSFDGTNYENVGVIMNPARYGTLTAAFASGADPDTTHTLSVTLNRTDMTLAGGAQADADQMRTLCMVDGELVSYQTATFVSAGNYNLGTYLRRGCYGSAIASHLINKPWARLDQSIVTLPLDAGMLGATIHFKFTSFNIFMQGTEQLSGVTDYTYAPPVGQVTGTGEGWKCVGSAVANAGRIFKAITGALTTWDSNASGKGIAGAAWVQGRAADAVGHFQLGLTSTPATASYTGGNFNLYGNAGALYVYESGTLQNGGTTVGSYVAGDVFGVRYDGKATYYTRNGTLVWTSRKPVAATTQLYPVAYFEDPGTGGVFDVVYGAGETTQAQQAGSNLLSNLPWLPGTSGNQGLFAATSNAAGSGGAAAQNSIILGDGSSATSPLGPYGLSEVLWQAQGFANTSVGTVGGFFDPAGAAQAAPYLGGDIVSIDPNKSYRVSCWVRFHGSLTAGSPQIYMGADTNSITLNVSGHTANTNPYYASTTINGNLAADKWYLMVGFLHGNPYAGGQSGISGFYDPVTGQIVVAGTDFVQAAGVNGQSVRIFLYYNAATGGLTTQFAWFAKPRFEEMNGNEPSVWSLMHPTSTVDPSSGLVLGKGSVPPIIPSIGISWGTTSGQIAISWGAFTLYRPDGTTTSVSSGSQTVTGLTNGTTYTFYPFVAEGSTVLSFSTGFGGSAGSPAIAYAGGSPTGAQGAYLFGNVPMNSFQATPSAGGGGGGGDNVGCMHPDTPVELADGTLILAGELGHEAYELVGPEDRPVAVRSVMRQPRSEWAHVYFRGQPEGVTVTLDHRFVQPDGALVRAGDLRLGDVVAGRRGRNLEVASLDLLCEEADMVSIGVDGLHYYLGNALSHNGNPKP